MHHTQRICGAAAGWRSRRSTSTDELLGQPALRSDMHIAFVPATDPNCDDVIEEAGLLGLVGVHALPIYHVRVDTDLWSMFMPSFAAQFHIHVC